MRPTATVVELLLTSFEVENVDADLGIWGSLNTRSLTGGSTPARGPSAYPETGGANTSGLHWDMIADLRKESEVRADAEVIYRNGTFLI